MKDKLNQCPFCGSDKIELYSRRGLVIENWFIECMSCYGAAMGPCNREKVIDAWNTRHSTTTTPQTVKDYKTRLGNALENSKRSVPISSMLHGEPVHYETVVYVGDISRIMQTLE